MGKLSKQEVKLQREILDLINSDKKLTDDDRYYIYENFNPGYLSDVTERGVFFTPIGLAQDLAVFTPKYGKIAVVCSGIGILSYRLLDMNYYHGKINSITLMEMSLEYLRITKRLLTVMKNCQGKEYEINFVQANVFDKNVWHNFTDLSATTSYNERATSKFNVIVSNPPYGRLSKDANVD